MQRFYFVLFAISVVILLGTVIAVGLLIGAYLQHYNDKGAQKLVLISLDGFRADYLERYRQIVD